MRTLLAVMLAALAFDALAQSTARARPPGTLPLEEIPPPLPLTETNTPQPEVTTRTEGDQTIQEYRINGKLYMTLVTPRHGRPYILMDQRGDGTFNKLDNTLDGQVRVPQWVLLEF